MERADRIGRPATDLEGRLHAPATGYRIPALVQRSIVGAARALGPRRRRRIPTHVTSRARAARIPTRTPASRAAGPYHGEGRAPVAGGVNGGTFTGGVVPGGTVTGGGVTGGVATVGWAVRVIER